MVSVLVMWGMDPWLVRHGLPSWYTYLTWVYFGTEGSMGRRPKMVLQPLGWSQPPILATTRCLSVPPGQFMVKYRWLVASSKVNPRRWCAALSILAPTTLTGYQTTTDSPHLSRNQVPDSGISQTITSPFPAPAQSIIPSTCLVQMRKTRTAGHKLIHTCVW